MCEAEDNAQWRSERLETREFLRREWERGKMPSPIFSCFGIFTFLFKVDWLHCADQGVGADFLGNLFAYLVAKKMPGARIEDRTSELAKLVREFYKENRVADQLKEFLPKTFQAEKKTKKPPSLKGNAASTRALIPFGDQMAKRFLLDDEPIELAMKSAAHHLNNCYNSLSDDNKDFCHDALYESSKQFALHYGALHEFVGDGVAWRPRPKMHLFLELCSSGAEPQKFWNYRDEDFGGTVAKQSKMKGIWRKLSSYAKHALDMYRMKNSVPKIN